MFGTCLSSLIDWIEAKICGAARSDQFRVTGRLRRLKKWRVNAPDQLWSGKN
jgi:hypothetical protein